MVINLNYAFVCHLSKLTLNPNQSTVMRGTFLSYSIGPNRLSGVVSYNFPLINSSFKMSQTVDISSENSPSSPKVRVNYIQVLLHRNNKESVWYYYLKE